MNIQPSRCIIAAGSGGHILPAQQLARSWKKTQDQSAVLWCTGNSPLEHQLVTTDGPDLVKHFTLDKFPGTKITRYPRFIWQFLTCLLKSFTLLRTDIPGKKIDAVVTTGGLLSIPICLAAWMLGIPIEIVELNAVPGRTTRLLAPISSKLYVVFESTQQFFPKMSVEKINYPLRFDYADMMPKSPHYAHKKTIALFGGSQGSRQLNMLLCSWLEQHPEHWSSLRILHYFGADTSHDFAAWYHQRGIEAVAQPFCTTMSQAYADADLVISRAGSGALHELLFFGKKSIIIPLPHVADNHQVMNAQEMAQQHPELFWVIVGSENAVTAQTVTALQSFMNQNF